MAPTLRARIRERCQRIVAPRREPVGPADVVVPMHLLDGHLMTRIFFVDIMFRFDEVLDPEMLRRSLERLISRDGWRKLGGRIKKRYGGYEFHIPPHFTPSTPAIRYSHLSHAFPIASHAIASQLPRPTVQTSVWPIPPDLHTLLHAPDRPSTLSKYIKQNLAPLGLHILSFPDATLVSLSWPHVLADGMGIGALLSAWSLVLQGREAEVPRFLGYDTDPLRTLGTHASAPFLQADRLLGNWGSVKHLAYLAVSWLLHRDRERVICVPGPLVRRLREEAMADLAARAETKADMPDSPPGRTPFLTEGDVLEAYLTRLALAGSPASRAAQTVAMINAYDMRRALAQHPVLLPPDGAYVSNAVSSLQAFSTVREVLERPLGDTAGRIRRSVAQMGTRAQVEAIMALSMDELRAGGVGLSKAVGEPGMRMVAFSNWTRGRFFEVDFGAAVVGREKGKGMVVPSYVANQLTSRFFPVRDIFIIVGKDRAGNYWTRVKLARRDWEKLERKLGQMENLEGAC